MERSSGLQFSSLRLNGFKSFADPAEIEIAQGMTGVVGPNGCGKSNLLEALSWVMGETSAKRMRGSGMDDVIFGGTEQRPPRNICEVGLVLENKARTAPKEFNDSDRLEIVRRIDRGQGSSYRVNGKPVRQRDVQVMFQDNGSGASSAAIVSQGRVGALINAKPSDRRSILEGAAGISGLHARRSESETKLSATEQNLVRIDDAHATMNDQLQVLRKQARQAARYRSIDGLIRQAEAAGFIVRRKLAADRHDAAVRQHANNAELVAEATAAVQAAELARIDTLQQLPALRDARSAAEAELARASARQESIQNEIRRLERELADAKKLISQASLDIERETSLASEAAEAKQRLSDERTMIAEDQAMESENLESLSEAADEASSLSAEIEAELSRLTAEAAALEAQRKNVRSRLVEEQNRGSVLQGKLLDIQAKIDALMAAMEADTGVMGLEAEAEELALRAGASIDALGTAEASVLSAIEAEDAARRAASEAQSCLDKARAELGALKAASNAVRGGSDHPVVDRITVTPGFEMAAAAALASGLRAGTDAAEAAAWMGADVPDEGCPSGTDPLIAHVSGVNEIRAAISMIGVATSDDEAIVAAAHLLPGQAVVTLAGKLWRWDGFVSGLEVTDAADAIKRTARLREIEAELPALQAATDEAASLSARAAEAVRDLRAAETAARQAHRATLSELDRVRASLAAAQKKAGEDKVRLDAHQETKISLEAELDACHEAAEGFRTALAEYVAAEELENNLTAVRSRLAAARATASAKKSSLDAFLRDSQERRMRLQAIIPEEAEWSRKLQGARQRIEELTARRSEAAETVERLSAMPDRDNDMVEAAASEVSRCQEASQIAQSALVAAETERDRADDALRQTEQNLSSLREERARREAEIDAAVQQMTVLNDAITEKLECSPDDLPEIAGLAPDSELPELKSCDDRIARLQREKESIGVVNLLAEDSVREMEDAMGNTARERDELREAVAKLRQAIADINREAREKLNSAFTKVDGHFRDLFTRLFGGGHAYLKLTGDDDPLAAGLEIYASPPGKKLQVLSLLSGGEQALTALSLIFAAFMTNPAPVCVLDEVDAPLDDANVDRLCSLMEYMAKGDFTRFLVITHHAMTMSRMDRLYGVTMAERGVSQPASLRLEDAVKFAETAEVP